ncbi:cadherin-89D [Eupeodes corollae]|uniref:cadherin-89D n=1 Tax=Eupeodes corollae TaxID=290404 RepID=UPI0024923CE5|nr:cadherin-89D [Eupeodes corollae]
MPEYLITVTLYRTNLYCVSTGCVFHTTDGLGSESEGVRFIRVREDTPIDQEILMLHAYPRSSIYLKSADGFTDHSYFMLHELNSTSVQIILKKSLESLVDRDQPQNLLKFRVLCTGKKGRMEETSFISVTVYIEDVNDQVPKFLNEPYIVEVEESTPPGSVIYRNIQAFDRDKPNTPNSEVHLTLSSSFHGAESAPYFALESPHRPLLILKRELDFDNGIREFRIPLLAIDRGTPPNQANTTVIVRVLDVDDMPPKFTEGVYRTKINEFYPMTGRVIRMPLYFSPPIMAYDQDSLNATLVYEIISGNERKLFDVNSSNGIIFLQKEIDLEEESLPGNTFVLQIESRQRDSPLKKAVARIEIEILDLNDNQPEFEVDYYNISIVENLPSGFSVLQVNAIDRDQGENAEFAYNLVEENSSAGAFLIDSRSGWITVREHRLLDREARKSIGLIVEAIEKNPSYDELNQEGPSSVQVQITLLDSNDNTPKFEKGNLYEFKVQSNAAVGTLIGKVMAYDPDEGRNGVVLYELQRPKGSGFIPFRLDPQTGAIFVAGPLRPGRIAVFIEATDQPANPSERRFSLAVVTIEVYATMGDEEVDFLGAPYEFWVGSDVPLGTSVGQVRTTLMYEGDDDILYDLLHSYSDGVPFAIEERSGIITVIRELKDFQRLIYYFEAVANFQFTNLTQGRQLTFRKPPFRKPLDTFHQMEEEKEGVLITNVTIHVVSQKELTKHPVIEEINVRAIGFHVEENKIGAIIGQLVYKNEKELEALEAHKIFAQMNAFKRLQPSTYRNYSTFIKNNTKTRAMRRLENGGFVALRYIIANRQEVMNKITITDDGTLMTITGLDREERDHYELTIIVEYSKGQISGAAIYQVNVLVDDVNDNPPIFDAPVYVGMINENCELRAEVFLNRYIKVSDDDAGKNAEFKVVLQGDGSEMFTVELANSSQNTVFNLFNLTEQWNEEQEFVDMQSFILGPNLTYSSGPHFRIRFTGRKGLDREREQFYKLKLIAVDSGGLSSVAQLNVLIADVNDNPPIFDKISVFKESNLEIREYTTDMEIFFIEKHTQQPISLIPSYNIPGSPRLALERHYDLLSREKRAGGMPKCPLFAMREDIVVGTVVLQVTATDDDYGKNARIMYEIESESVNFIGRPTGKVYKNFAIDKLTGELKVNSPPEAMSEVTLKLKARDIGNLFDTTCIRFTIVDVNNHAPLFKKSWYSFDIHEGPYVQHSLDRIEATDMDYGQNANITYSLKADEEIPFTISPISGVLKIDGLLDREHVSIYNFHVMATDNSEESQRMTSSVEVEINILDVNDNAPEFIGYDDLVDPKLYNLEGKTQIAHYRAFLGRNSMPGTFVKQISAVDKDYTGNGNGLVLFSLVHKEMPSLFQIDSRDGVVTTIGDFNKYNGYEHLNMTIIASDLGSPTQSSTAVLLVNLQGQLIVPEAEMEEEFNTDLFPHRYYEVGLEENNMSPMEIITINLTSRHKPEAYRWSLVPEVDSTDHQFFDIDPTAGVVYASKSFDRELKETYRLKIRAEKVSREGRNFAKMKYPVADERVLDLSYNEVRVVVMIIDENDNTPKFRGRGRPIVAVIPNTANFGYPVTTVEALDADKGINSEIRYKLLNEPSRLFGIDEVTGKIRVLNSVGIDQRVYGFDVKATDRRGADDGRSSIANVFVYVLDEKREVRLVIAGRPVEVEKQIEALTTRLSDTTQMDVKIRMLEPHEGGEEIATDAYVYAVDLRTNAVVDMETLHSSLSQLVSENSSSSVAEPRIIEVSDFGTLRSSSKSVSIMGGTEIISLVLAVLILAGACTTALCLVCFRQKRWTEQEFPSSETGLTYTIARLNDVTNGRGVAGGGIGGGGKALRKTISSPESMCSTHSSSTLQKPDIFHKTPTILNNDMRPREYIDVPLPKSIIKANRSGGPVEHEPMSYGTKYSTFQTPNNLTQHYDTSLHSHHSSGRDSGVDFISHRERSETPSEILKVLQRRQSVSDIRKYPHTESGVCFAAANDSSDSYEDSLKNEDVTSTRACSLHSIPSMQKNNQKQQLCELHKLHSYQNTNFHHNRIRHSFSGVKDDLMQSSPRVSLRPRGHLFRNSMTDLEQRLHNLEQSFRKSDSIY